jgi:hypothetical protein
MHVSDNLYTGPAGPNGICTFTTVGGIQGASGTILTPQGCGEDGNPTMQYGVGPLGRLTFLNIVPTAISTTNLAALQALTANTPMALVAGAGTLGRAYAPDGSGALVTVLDSNRCVSITSTGSLASITFTVVGYDLYGRKQTCAVTGPANSTVTTLKAFIAVLSITPSAGSASQVSAGVADIFGLPWVAKDAGYVVSAKWNNTLAQNAGTFTAADLTSPATSATGDPRGTFAQAGAASNGSIRLVIAQHVDSSQCGPFATPVNAIGVTPA